MVFRRKKGGEYMGRSDKRPPDFKLQLKEKDGDGRNNFVGVAWHNNSGGINIKLNPGIALTYELSERYFLTLWALSEEEYRKAYQRMNPGQTPPPRPNDNEDIPF